MWMVSRFVRKGIKRYQFGKNPKISKIILKEQLKSSRAHAQSHRIMKMKYHNITVPHALFEEAEKLNMSIIMGAWFNPGDNFFEATHTLYFKWHNRDRAKYAVMIRFAPGSSYTQLQQASKLLDTYVRVVLVAVLSTVPYGSLTPSTNVFSKEHILVLPILRGVIDIDWTFV
jgi:hypothetical protein